MLQMEKGKNLFIVSTALHFAALWYYVCSNSNVTVPLGTTATLKCRIEGVPLEATVVVWSDRHEGTLSINNNITKTEDPRFSIAKPYHNEFNLHIRNVKMSDQGPYNCKAFKDEKVFFNITINLQIHVPPKARTPHSTNISVTEGEEVILECYGEGVPEPELDWKYHKKDTPVEETIIMENTSKYVIKNITLRQSGHYECQASNNVPPISSVHYYVDVLSKPRIHVPYVRILQRVGHYISLQCLITWNPKGEVHWEHKGAVISDIKSQEPAKYRHSLHKMEGNTWNIGLLVHQFDISDGGRYKCHATNKYGTSHGFIEVAAYHSTGGVGETEDEQMIHASPGSNVVLHCEGKGHPISWSKQTITMKDFEVIKLTLSGEINTVSKYKLMEGGSLKIFSVSKLDQGFYVCASKSNTTTYLTVTDSEASRSCDQDKISLKTVAIIIAITIFILGTIFATLILILRHKYRKHLNTSGESVLTSSRPLTARKP